MDTLELYTIFIQEFGYPVEGFADPYSLLEFIHNYPAQIGFVIIEYRMKHMTGCDFANEVNSLDPQIRMVFVTGYDDIIGNKLELEILKKPIKLTQLLNLINKYMK